MSRNWTASEHDARLWGLYESNEIDPNNNDPPYLWEKAQLHFSDWVNGLKPGASGRNQAIRRLRDKNAIQRTQIAGNGVRGMYTILQTLCCCYPCLTVPSRETSLPNAAAENHFEDEEEDEEDFEENEYQN